MSGLPRLLRRSSVALVAIIIAGCGELDRSVAPTETVDGPMLPNEPVFAFRMTGGGRIDDTEGRLPRRFTEPGVCRGASFATFGFNAGPTRDGGLTGTMEWVDHCRGITIHGTAVTAFRAISGTGATRARGCAEWEGPATLNGVEGYRFRVQPACDEGEPGWRTPGAPTDLPDWIAMELVAADGTVIYLRHGALTGGNIQTHQVP